MKHRVTLPAAFLFRIGPVVAYSPSLAPLQPSRAIYFPVLETLRAPFQHYLTVFIHPQLIFLEETQTKMKFLLVVKLLFLVSTAATTSVCSEDICRACSMIHASHPFCQKIAKSKCCEAWLNENHHSLVPSANHQDFDKQMTSVPEIFEEKEAAHFTVSNITVMCLSLVAFVMLVCKLERIIARIVKTKSSDKYDKNNRRWTSESQKLLL